MNPWFQNYVELDGPVDEIARFRTVFAVQDTQHGCRSLCLHRLAELIPNYDPHETICAITLYDDPYNVDKNSFVVDSAHVSIAGLLGDASTLFPKIKFHLWYSETISKLPLHERMPHSMDIHNGNYSNEVVPAGNTKIDITAELADKKFAAKWPMSFTGISPDLCWRVLKMFQLRGQKHVSESEMASYIGKAIINEIADKEMFVTVPVVSDGSEYAREVDQAEAERALASNRELFARHLKESKSEGRGL